MANKTSQDSPGALRRAFAAWSGSGKDDFTEIKARLGALDRSQATIEFDMEGRVLTANENFLRLVGYRLEEIRGQHHGTLVDTQYRASPEYRALWDKLRRGEYHAGLCKRIAKSGRELWLQASYNPVLDANGRPCKVWKVATDVTAQMTQAHQMQSTVAQTQTVIRSALSGDLSQRLSAAGISGDALQTCEAINLLLSTVGGLFAELREVVTGATEGDLTARVATAGKTGELLNVAESINSLLDGVTEIVTSVKGAAGEVLCGAEEISQGTLSLSQRTEEQSSSLEQTASSMEEMTSTVKQNADNAGQANQLAAAARDQAEKGGSVVGKAVAAMAKINDASKKIADIIGVIDEIAFQTNLLALNAAVEAARAGEQGRGFAVVASEVRTLAGRSATAAKEIKELIQDSVRKVEDGSTLVTQSGQTLDQIVTSVKKVSDIVAEIAAASREQSAGIEQVNQAVLQMDQTTQQNAALVEEATAASQGMAEQARQLTALMERYNALSRADSGARSSRLAARGTAGKAPRAAAPATSRAKTPASSRTAERRSIARPWAEKSQPVPKAEPAATQAAASDPEWVEF